MTTDQTEPVTIAGTTTIHEPGIYPDLQVDEYHADPVPDGSLSSTGARRLLAAPPAVFRWEQDNPKEPTDPMKFGTAAHRVVLGSGPELVKLPFPNKRTKAAQEFIEEAEAEGAIVLTEDQWEHVHGMAAAIKAHPLASTLFDPDHGQPEQSLFWRDVPTGTMLRARVDWLPDRDGGRLIVPEYKTAVSAAPDDWTKTAANLGYHMQEEFYVSGLRTHELAEEIAFVFVVQEKTPPYLIHVVQFRDQDRMLAGDQNRRAIDLYAKCKRSGVWPGYPEVSVVDLPTWYRIQNGG